MSHRWSIEWTRDGTLSGQSVVADTLHDAMDAIPRDATSAKVKRTGSGITCAQCGSDVTNALERASEERRSWACPCGGARFTP